VSPLFNIVLHEPEIPNNTGNIGRTCIATGCALHLVLPLGFSTSEKACRRAGLDYWPRLSPTEHADWPTFLSAAQPPPQRTWLFTTKTSRPCWDASFEPGDYLVFGKETAGLPDHLLNAFPTQLLTLPMVPSERSLNLATAVCAAIYEGLRQLVDLGAAKISDDGRLVSTP
jgi:tRNA (cytidine/uridine-2'-O-)-methyltransferase